MDTKYGAKPKAEISEVDGIILDMISQGATNTEIAQRIHYSTASAKGRVRRLMRNLGAKNRVELAAKATQLDIVAEELLAEGLTHAETVFLREFVKLPAEMRGVIAEVGLALSEALSGRLRDR